MNPRRLVGASAWQRLDALGRGEIYVLIGGIPVALLLSFLSIKYVETAFIVCWFLTLAIWVPAAPTSGVHDVTRDFFSLTPLHGAHF